MRSKAKHDEWQKLLLCKQIVLNGADDLEKNFRKIGCCICRSDFYERRNQGTDSFSKSDTF